MNQLLENELLRITSPVGRSINAYNGDFFLTHKDYHGEVTLLAQGSSLQALVEDFVGREEGSTCSNKKPEEEATTILKVSYEFRENGNQCEVLLSSWGDVAKFCSYKYVINPVVEKMQ